MTKNNIKMDIVREDSDTCSVEYLMDRIRSLTDAEKEKIVLFINSLKNSA